MARFENCARYLSRMISAVLILVPWSAQAQRQYPVPFASVQNALERLGVHASSKALHMPAPVFSSQPDPEVLLESANLSADHVLELRFRCKTPASCPPFLASLSEADEQSVATAFSLLHPQLQAAVTSTAPTPQIHAGQHVLLVMEDSKMKIAVPVIAIDTGPLNTQIRVATLDRKQTFRAVVAAQDTVRGAL